VLESSDYRKILDDKNIEAVVIATPLHLHYDMAVDSLKAGKHVYLEKTMTYSIAQAVDLVKLSKTFPKQVLQIGHQTRYLPLYKKVKDMIKQGYLGKVTQIDCRYDRNGSWRRPVPDPAFEKTINWRMYKAYSGGLVAELLSHQMDFIHWAFDTHPDEVFATGGIDYYKDGRETYDNVQVMFRYHTHEMIGNFGSMCANAVELLFDQGVYYPELETKKELQVVDAVSGATKIQWNEKGGIPIMKEPMKESTWYALDEFHTCVRQQQIPLSNVVTGGTTAVSVHLANEAMYNHSVQKWKPEYDFTF
jgi:predicted dehydrogenase